MFISTNDILLRSYKGEKTLWLSERLVMDVCGLSDNHLRKNRSKFRKSIKKYHYGDFLPETGKNWRFGRANDTFYYEYDSLPDRRDTSYRSKFGTRDEILGAYERKLEEFRKSEGEKLERNILNYVEGLEDNTDIEYYMYHCGFSFNIEKSAQMARSRAWCRYVVLHIEKERYKELGIATLKGFYEKCTRLIFKEKLEGLRVKTGESLRKKINKYKVLTDINYQRDFFISGRYGNNNAQKVGKYPIVDKETGEYYDLDLHQVMMGHLYMNPGNSTKESIKALYDRYKRDVVELFPEFNQKPIAYRTFLHHIRRWNIQILTAKSRHGIDYYKKHVLTYTTTEKLKYAHSLFAGDGSGIISYKYSVGGKLKHRKLYVTMITDVSSRYIVGFGFAPEGSSAENEKATEEAVKMSVENCNRRTLFEFVSDNHRSFTSKGVKTLLKMAFNKVRTIEVGNSQSNPAETQFRLFKSSLKDIKNFVSSSWGARNIENEANPDFLNIEEFPTYSEAIIQFGELVERWNNSPLRDGITPRERFENKNPECKVLEPRRLRYLFGNHTKVDLGYMRGYVQVHKTRGYDYVDKYTFEIPDFGGEGTERISKLTNNVQNPKVKVVWDEKGADIYNLDDEYILSCKPSLKSSNAEIETSELHKIARRHHLSRKQNQLKHVENYENKVEELFYGLSYGQSIALGGDKESFNSAMEDNLNSENSTKKKKLNRIEREFKNSPMNRGLSSNN